MGINATTHPCVWECVWFNWWTVIRPLVAHHMGTPLLTPNTRACTNEQTAHTRLFVHRHIDMCKCYWPYCFLFSSLSGCGSLYNHIKWKFNLHTSIGRLRFPSISDSSKWVGGIFRLVFLSFTHQQPGKLQLCCSLVWNRNCSYVESLQTNKNFIFALYNLVSA